MRKLNEDARHARPCRLCKLNFRPTCKNTKNARDQEFCCEAHRKEFWKHGAQPLEKLIIRMEKRFRAIAKEEVQALRQEFENHHHHFEHVGELPPEFRGGPPAKAR